MRNSILKVCGWPSSNVVGAKYHRKFGCVIGTLPWARGNIAEVTCIVVTESCCFPRVPNPEVNLVSGALSSEGQLAGAYFVATTAVHARLTVPKLALVRLTAAPL